MSHQTGRVAAAIFLAVKSFGMPSQTCHILVASVSFWGVIFRITVLRDRKDKTIYNIKPKS